MSNTRVLSPPQVKDDIKQRQKVQNPKNYKVVLYNNHITAFEAVVDVLKTVFLKSHAESVQIMWYAHNSGFALVIISTKEICEAKADEAKTYCMSKKDDAESGRNMGYEHLQFEVEEDESNS
jgi:ATP-dependent Clp protease adaptor protein ClpS